MSYIDLLIYNQNIKKQEENKTFDNENVLQISIDDLNELKYFDYLENLKNKKEIKEDKRVIEIDL